MTINEVIQPNYTRDTKQYKEYKQALDDHHVTVHYLTDDLTFEINEVNFKIHAPLQENYEQSNDFRSLHQSHTKIIVSYLQEMPSNSPK